MSWATSGSSAKSAAAAWGSCTRPSRSRWAAGWPQGPAVRGGPGPAAAPAVQDRGPGRGPAAPHQHRAGLLRRLRARRPLLRHAVHRGPDPGPGDRRTPANGGPSPHRRAMPPFRRKVPEAVRMRVPDRPIRPRTPRWPRSAATPHVPRSDPSSSRTREYFRTAAALGIQAAEATRPRPQARHRPPRHQAGQSAARRSGQPLDHRFRPGPAPGRRRPDDHRRHAGHAPLHEPRAGAGQAGLPGPSDRHLLAGRDALRAGDTAAGRSTGRTGRRSSARSHRRSRPLRAARPGDSPRAGDDPAQGDEQGAGSRYATAQELADDLERFLEHKPIRAKRADDLERASKWARRHTHVVGSASWC